MTNPYSKSNPNPKKDPTRKAAAQAKKACRKGPTKGPPIDLEDADLPKLPDGTLDFDSMKASLGKSDATAANRKASNCTTPLLGRTLQAGKALEQCGHTDDFD